jgi:protein ImuA
MRTETIAQLRAALAKPHGDDRARVALGVADECLKGGLKPGACHEVFAVAGHETAATGFMAGLAWRIAAGKTVLWIVQDFSALEHGALAATGLVELGIDPSRVLMLRVAHAEDALRAASDALTCAALGAVVIEIVGTPKVLDLTASRRLTLAAAENGVTALLLRFGTEPDASSAETRWLVRAAPSRADDLHWGRPAYECELVRNRQGSTGRWVMEWSSDDGIFREQADRGAVVPAVVDRPAAAALEAHRRTAA